MGREEQIEEREVLDSIFPDEITGELGYKEVPSLSRPILLTPRCSPDISETEYRITIALDVPGDEEEEEPPAIVLTVRYPEDYPDKAPNLELSAPQNALAHEYFNVADDKEQLLEGLAETIEENLGMAMVFTLVSTLKEAAEQLVVERREAAEKVREEALLEAERKENQKFHGTLVTPEVFIKWRENFLKEMEEARLKEEEEKAAESKKTKAKEPVKLTGKQLWETGLAGRADQEGEEDDSMIPTEGIETIKIAES